MEEHAWSPQPKHLPIAHMEITTDVEGENGEENTLTIYDRSELSLLRLIREVLLLTWDNYNGNPDNEEAKRWVDNGLWGFYRPEREDGSKGDTLSLSVNIGCSCAHDCCAHVCYQGWEVSALDESRWLVKTTRHINI